MKQTLLFTLSFFAIVTLMTACSSQMADKMAVVGNPALSSDPCVAIDEKVMRLDRFTEVVNNTSAFYLEEKATALTVPGITVSNNRKQMLKDAEKKYTEYSAEYQKYGCETPRSTGTAQFSDPIKVVDNPTLPSDRCAAIDRKVIRLDRFTEVVNNTSAFHLEEKATAIPIPGITVSNNKKQMLRDVKKKYAEYAQERQKYACKTPPATHNLQTPDKKEVVPKSVLSSEPTAQSDTKVMKRDEFTPKVNHSSTLHTEEKAAVLPVPEITGNKKKEQTVSDVKKKDAQLQVARQKRNAETPMVVKTVQIADKKAEVSKPAMSSDTCDAIDRELVKLYEFMIMLENTSAFHLEERAQAMTVPGITVSNNKKKMLKDAERKRAELLAKREQNGCETAENE